MGEPASHCEQSASAPASGRQHRRNERIAACLATLAGTALGLLSLAPQSPALVWNFSESVPVGLYRIEGAAAANGDVVALAPSGRVRAQLDAYAVLPAGRLLLKQVAAMPGDTICRKEAVVTVNGAIAAIALLQARDGRALPVWNGCRVLNEGEMLVLAPHPASFDGRYLGPISADQVVGIAHPLFILPLPEVL